MRVIEFSNHSFWLHLRTDRWAKHRVGNYGPPSPKRAGASRPRDRGVRFKYLDRPNSLEVTGPFEKPEGPGLASRIQANAAVRPIYTPAIHLYSWNNSTESIREKCILRALTWESTWENEKSCFRINNLPFVFILCNCNSYKYSWKYLKQIDSKSTF